MNLWMKILVIVVFVACGFFYGLGHKATEERGGLKTPLIVIVAVATGCAGWLLLGLESMVWQTVTTIAVLAVNIFDKKFSQISFTVIALFFVKLLFDISAGRFGQVEAAWWVIGAMVAFIVALMALYKTTIVGPDHDTEEHCHHT